MKNCASLCLTQQMMQLSSLISMGTLDIGTRARNGSTDGSKMTCDANRFIRYLRPYFHLLLRRSPTASFVQGDGRGAGPNLPRRARGNGHEPVGLAIGVAE